MYIEILTTAIKTLRMGWKAPHTAFFQVYIYKLILYNNTVNYEY